MRTIILFLFLGLTSSILIVSEPYPVFGVNVSVGPNTAINHYTCYINNGRTLSLRSKYDHVSFGKVLTGRWPSVYNPDRIDLLKENKIEYTFEHDAYLRRDYFNCPAIDSLWKIRFSISPYTGSSEEGWSNGLHMPSLKQRKYLFDRYEISHIDSDYFLDTNFFKILRDVVDPIWIETYKAMQ